MVRCAALLTVCLLATGCTAARMAGFDDMAADGALQPVAMTGVPGWRDGTFRLGSAVGHVRRRAKYDAIGWGTDKIGGAFDNVRFGEAVKYGNLAIELDSPDVGGRLEVRCRYGRSELRDQTFVGDIAQEGRPLELGCAYRLNGRNAGWLDLGAARRTSNADRRLGNMTLDGVALSIRSSHDIAGLPFELPDPVGYTARAADGRTVAALELNHATSRRLLLPRDPAQRTAAAAALVTMALFWDPGDVG